jgi:ribosomal protein S18 acetylase RimI-like enzyme
LEADVIEVRPLGDAELDQADAVLPLHRLDRPASQYLVAWDGEAPVGHVCLQWIEPPELQDLWVLPDRRSGGIGRALIAAAERETAARGHGRLLLSVGVHNERALSLYERLGYTRTETPPQRIKGTIRIRGRPLAVDDTLLEYEKPVDSAQPRSS